MIDDRRGPGTAFTTLGAVLARRWPVVLLITLLCGSIWFGLELIRADRFSSTARVLIQTQDLGSSLAEVPTQGSGDPSREFATETEIASLAEVQERAAATIESTQGTDASARHALSVAVNADGTSNVMQFTINSARAAYAQAYATSYAQEYVRYREELQTSEYRKARNEILDRAQELADQGGVGSLAHQDLVAQAQRLQTLIIVGGGRARLISPGDEPRQVAPKPTRAAIVGLGLGLLLAIALALLIERLDGHVRGDAELEELLGVPVIGRLPDPRKLDNEARLVMLAAPDAPTSEGFRVLRANVGYALGARGGKGVMVTSAKPGDGKTFTAANLALAAAAAGRRVALVDLDLRSPSVHRAFGIDLAPGLTDVVAGVATLESALSDVAISRNAAPDGAGSLIVLTAGCNVPNPGEFILAPSLWDVVKGLEAEVDFMVIDAPPALAVSDPAALGGLIGSTIIVVRSGDADRGDLAHLREVLQQGGPQPIGIALTAVRSGRRGYGYGYGHGAENAGSSASAAAQRDGAVR